jgi:hypothetical protein
VAKVGTSPGAEATPRLKELVEAVALLRSVTVTVSGKVPAWIGVPESTPAELNVIPVGRVLEVEKLNEALPPVAVIDSE